MTYAQLIANLAVYSQQVPPNQAEDFTNSIPLFINNAELRILRDLNDILASHGQNTRLAFTIGSPNLSLTSMPAQAVAPKVFQGATLAYLNPVTVERVEALIPLAGSVAAHYVDFQRVSLAFIQNVWPASATTAVPAFGLAWWAMVDDQSIIVAPTPPVAYAARITGTWRPATLSGTNTTSYISLVYPDLLFIACEVEVAGYQANYSAASDDPRQALSWNGRYQVALAAARGEELRRKGLSPPPIPAAAAPAQAG